MADKQLTFEEEARTSLMRGVDQLGRVVGLTLGPSGRNVLLSRMFTLPVVCSDGVTIAKEVELADPYENMGAQLVKEAASKTNDVVGDGTTTSVVLAQAIRARKKAEIPNETQKKALYPSAAASSSAKNHHRKLTTYKPGVTTNGQTRPPCKVHSGAGG